MRNRTNEKINLIDLISNKYNTFYLGKLEIRVLRNYSDMSNALLTNQSAR